MNSSGRFLALVMAGAVVGAPDLSGDSAASSEITRVESVPAELLFACNPNPRSRAFRACYGPGTSVEYMDEFEFALHGGFPPAYSSGGRWSFTATDGSTGANGTPITLTYSFVPDYTTGDPATSNVLHQAFDAAFGSRDAWQNLFRDIFADWSAVTGIDLVEVSDDGSTWPSSPGVVGLRGDIRIVSFAVDGPANVLAYNYFPDTGDMALDSAEDWANSANDYRFFRNIVMHELGHGVGLDHVLPRDHTKLMEAFLNLNFLGPQDDDLRGVSYSYGDLAEPNETAGAAVNLGAFSAGAAFENLALHSASDDDWFYFVTAPGQTVAVRVEPVGSQYDIGPDPGSTQPIDTAAINALRVDVFDEGGATQLRSASAALGQSAETVSVDVPAGDAGILVRVSTDDIGDDVQRYRLVLADSNVALRTLSVMSTPTVGFSIGLSPADVAGSSSVITSSNATYAENETVLLTAPAETGNASFVRWKLDGADQTPGDNTLVVVMNANHTAEAVYVLGLAVVVGEDTDILAGESAQLSAVAVGGDPPYAIYWAPANTLSNASATNPLASPVQTTTYVVTVTDGSSAQASDGVTVRVVPPLVADAGVDRFVVPGMAFTLSASVSGGSAPYTYAWSPADGLADPSARWTVGTVSATTGYTLTVRDAFGRTASDSVTIEVVGRPTVDAGIDRAMGSGGSVVLTADSAGGAPPYSYAWTPRSAALEADGHSVRVSPVTDTTYAVVVTDALGQQASDSVRVRLAEALQVSAQAEPATIDLGASAALSAIAGGGVPPFDYVWSPADTVSAPTRAQTAAAPGVTTTYTVTVRDGSGQTASAAIEVTVFDPALLPPPLPGLCGFGLVGAWPLTLLMCASLRFSNRRRGAGSSRVS